MESASEFEIGFAALGLAGGAGLELGVDGGEQGFFPGLFLEGGDGDRTHAANMQRRGGCHAPSEVQEKFSASMSKTTVTSSGSVVRASTAWTWRVSGRARWRAQGDLETELAVRADQRRGQHLAERDARREILRQPQVQGLQGELGAALVVRAGC